MERRTGRVREREMGWWGERAQGEGWKPARGRRQLSLGQNLWYVGPSCPGIPARGPCCNVAVCVCLCVCKECAPHYSVARKKQTTVRFTRCYALCTMLCDKTNKIVMRTTRIMSAVVQGEKYIILIWPKSRSVVVDRKTTKLKEKNQ